jgi:hypothetical protein
MTTDMNPMVVGDRVYWTPDGELGTILAIDEFIIAIAWDFSGIETYSMSCGAVDRIAPRTKRFSCEYKRWSTLLFLIVFMVLVGIVFRPNL